LFGGLSPLKHPRGDGTDTVHLLPKDLKFEYGDAKLAFLDAGVFLTLGSVLR